MRQFTIGSKLLILLWVFILLRSGIILVMDIVYGYPDSLMSIYTYLDIGIFAAMVAMFVFILKGHKNMILILFGVILALESFEIAPLAGTLLLAFSKAKEIINSPIELANYLASAGVYPIFFVAYSITYIVCLFLYLFNKRARHTLISVACVLAVVFILGDLISVATGYMLSEEGFELFDIFFDFVKIVFFGIIYFSLPQEMHSNNLD